MVIGCDPDPGASEWPLAVTWARGINTEPVMAGAWTQTWPSAADWVKLSSWPYMAVQATEIGTAPPCESVALGHQCGTRWQHRPQAPACPPVATGVTDINTDPLSCFRATDQDLAMGHRPSPDLSLDSGGQLAVHVSLFLTTLTSPDPPLSQVHKPLPLSHLPSLYSLTTTVPDHPASGRLAIAGGACLSTARPSHREWGRAVASSLSCVQA